MSKKLLDTHDKWKYFALGILVALIMFGTCSSNAKASPNMMVDSVKLEIEQIGIQHPDIVLKQSIWETGWFGCERCSLRFNNIFGFRHKSHISEDNPKGYIKFENWKESVAYYKMWQDTFYSGGDYYKFLLRIGYAEDENYIQNIKSIRV